MWTSMGAQFVKHKNLDDLATSGWKHLYSMQSNFKKFEEIWRFILLTRRLFRRWAGRQNLNAVVWALAKIFIFMTPSKNIPMAWIRTLLALLHSWLSNSARKARSAHSVRNCVRCARAIPKTTMANRWQYPSVPSCRISLPSFTPG